MLHLVEVDQNYRHTTGRIGAFGNSTILFVVHAALVLHLVRILNFILVPSHLSNFQHERLLEGLHFVNFIVIWFTKTLALPLLFRCLFSSTQDLAVWIGGCLDLSYFSVFLDSKQYLYETEIMKQGKWIFQCLQMQTMLLLWCNSDICDSKRNYWSFHFIWADVYLWQYLVVFFGEVGYHSWNASICWWYCIVKPQTARFKTI